jgi:hypothetical protein
VTALSISVGTSTPSFAEEWKCTYANGCIQRCAALSAHTGPCMAYREWLHKMHPSVSLRKGQWCRPRPRRARARKGRRAAVAIH